ncbi:MAG TPA: transcription elongation factor GreA [Armatimonadota bacterium]|nr:transcription elongation factor GreA [Armatimonadota bacterium]
MASIYLTRKGYERLTAELRELVDVRRPQVKADLVTAREFGDLRENAEYDTAKRDQGMIEGRIHDLENLLSSVEIVEVPKHITEAVLGARVRVENMDFNQEREYVLVSEQEAHLEDDYLSAQSPLGKALLGHKVGEIVTFEAPAGVRRFKILDMKKEDNIDE